MDIRRAYRKFRVWQHRPALFRTRHRQERQCENCGGRYEGNYCPCCGQKGTVGRITWASVLQGIGEVWGLGNRSLPYTVLQLFLRPGHLISDYINGRRQVSFPPVKMLALVALLGVLVDHLSGTHDGIQGIKLERAVGVFYLDEPYRWLLAHPDMLTIVMFSWFIVPAYFIFRFAPRNDHHTLPQGFFIQVFNSVLYLFLNMFWDITSLDWLPFVLGVLYLYVIYKQLFGYGVWGTIWRVALMFLCAVITYCTLLSADWTASRFALYGFSKRFLDASIGLLCFNALLAALIWMGYAISRRTARRTAATAAADNTENTENEEIAESTEMASATQPQPELQSAAAKQDTAPAKPENNKK